MSENTSTVKTQEEKSSRQDVGHSDFYAQYGLKCPWGEGSLDDFMKDPNSILKF
jgi:hypothetical protein